MKKRNSKKRNSKKRNSKKHNSKKHNLQALAQYMKPLTSQEQYLKNFRLSQQHNEVKK